MKNFMILIVQDSAMIISNSEYILEKNCLLDDDFKTNLNFTYFEINDKSKFYRLKRIFYTDNNDDVIYITQAFFEYTDNDGEIKVEYIKED